MSGNYENINNELNSVRKQIEVLKERAELLKAEGFNLPTAKKIESIAEVREEIADFRGGKSYEMEGDVSRIEIELLRDIITPILPTLVWEDFSYIRNGGAIRASLPEFIIEVIRPIFPRYREVQFMLVNNVTVVVSNHNVALDGSKATEYAITVLGMDKTASKRKSRLFIESQQREIARKTTKLNEMFETHRRVFGDDCYYNN